MPRAATARRPAAAAAPFGRWLLSQTDRAGLVGQLAVAAGADAKFPKDGSPADVRQRLLATQASGDMFEALDDAEIAWPAP